MITFSLMYLSNTLLAMYSTIATVKPSAAPPMAQSTSLLLPKICLPVLAGRTGRTGLWLTDRSGLTGDNEVILPVLKSEGNVTLPLCHFNNNMEVWGRNLAGESERREEGGEEGNNIC